MRAEYTMDATIVFMTRCMPPLPIILPLHCVYVLCIIYSHYSGFVWYMLYKMDKLESPKV